MDDHRKAIPTAGTSSLTEWGTEPQDPPSSHGRAPSWQQGEWGGSSSVQGAGSGLRASGSLAELLWQREETHNKWLSGVLGRAGEVGKLLYRGPEDRPENRPEK